MLKGSYLKVFLSSSYIKRQPCNNKNIKIVYHDQIEIIFMRSSESLSDIYIYIHVCGVCGGEVKERPSRRSCPTYKDVVSMYSGKSTMLKTSMSLKADAESISLG